MQNTIAANIKARLNQWFNNPKTPPETDSSTARTYNYQIPDQLAYAEPMYAFGSLTTRPIDFQFESWNHQTIFGSHNHFIHADYSQRFENLIQAMGSFMHRRDDWIVIDDPVMPGKSYMDALNLMGHG